MNTRLLSDGWLENGCIECPLHAAQFDIRTGKAMSAPADEDIAVYAIKAEGDDLMVQNARMNSLSASPPLYVVRGRVLARPAAAGGAGSNTFNRPHRFGRPGAAIVAEPLAMIVAEPVPVRVRRR